MAHQWYVFRDNKKYGPYSEQHLRSFIGEGRLKGDTPVWCRGMKDWARVADVEPFRSHFVGPRARPSGKPTPTTKPAMTRSERQVGKKIGASIAVVIIIAIVSLWVILQIFGQPSRAPKTASEYKAYVTPNDPTVQSTLSYILANKPLYRTEFGAIQEWASSNITYVRDDGEYWQTPKETIERKKGDCEDFSTLLCSLLRARGIPADQVYVAVGVDSEGNWHAFLIENWYSGKWRVIEPQYGGLFETDIAAWRTALTYNISAYFNDQYFGTTMG
jgi:hypothetical protein